jgi:DNA-binding beta-propeller fold protein YncE
MRKHIWIICLVLCSSFLLFGQQAQKSDYTLLVLSHANQMLYDVNVDSGKILREVKIDPENDPHETTVSPDGNTIFISIPDSDRVVGIDTNTFKEKVRIESEYFKRPPVKLANGRTGQTTNAPPRETSTSALPHGLAMTQDGGKLYIGVENAVVPGIVVYDIKAARVLKKIDLVLRGGHYFAIQPSTGKLYYPFRIDNRVLVLDTKTDKILKVIPVQGGPVGVDFAPNGEVWIHEDGDASVTVIDSKTDEVVKIIKTEGKGAGRIDISPDGRYAASSHGDSEDTVVIDTVQKTIVANVKTGKGPSFPVFSPDSAKLFVMNSGDNDVAIVDIPAMNVSAKHKIGTVPFAGGVRRVIKPRE